MDDFENINETETEETQPEETETEETQPEETETEETEPEETETEETATEETQPEETETEETDEEWIIDEGGQIALTEVNPNIVDNTTYLENISTAIVFLDACIIGCFVALMFAIGFKKQ